MEATAAAKPKRLPFSRMSAVQRRVAIAEDVVAQIKLGRYQAEAGVYVDISVHDASLPWYDQPLYNLQQQCDAAHAGEAKQCAVCALGAGVVSAAALFNKLDYDAVGHDKRDVYHIIERYFPKRTRAMLECAFEREEMFGEDVLSEATIEACVAYGAQWNDDDARLEALWRNVAANDGVLNLAWMPRARHLVVRHGTR